MKKTFANTAPRAPKPVTTGPASAASDPAFAAAADAFRAPVEVVAPAPPVPAAEEPRIEPQIPERPVSKPAVGVPPVVAAAERETPAAPRATVKKTFYPTVPASRRMRQFKRAYRISDAAVLEYALDDLLATSSLEAVAADLRAQGHGRLRAATDTAAREKRSVGIRPALAALLENAKDEHGVTEALVCEFAVDRIFARDTNDALAVALQERGAGLRRS